MKRANFDQQAHRMKSFPLPTEEQLCQAINKTSSKEHCSYVAGISTWAGASLNPSHMELGCYIWLHVHVRHSSAAATIRLIYQSRISAYSVKRHRSLCCVCVFGLPPAACTAWLLHQIENIQQYQRVTQQMNLHSSFPLSMRGKPKLC